MEFIKYSSIENHYREKVVDWYRENGLENVGWILTEKIHGANFSFWCNSSEVKVASRNQWVDSTFYSCQDIIDAYTPVVLELATFFPNSTVAVYGELYGPGIQKGVNYGDKKDFVAFDIRVDGYFLDRNKVHVYIAGANQLTLQKHGQRSTLMDVVPIVGSTVSLTQVLEFDNEFVSVLGRLNGVDDDANLAEGFIATPVGKAYQRIGSDRVILKSKGEKWTEKSKKVKTPRAPVTEHPLTSTVEQYVNTNRVDAVTSKMGPLTPKDFGRIIRAVCDDVIDDMVKDGDVRSCWRDDEETKDLGKVVNKVVVPFLKKELLPTL